MSAHQGPRYALVHEGQVFICLRSQDMQNAWETSRVYARWEGGPVELERRVRQANQHFGYWFAGPGDVAPAEVIVHQPDRTRTLSYRLADERLKGTLPETLTVEEYRDLADDESDKYDPVAVRVYEAVTERYSPEPTILRDFLRLDGEPWPETDRTWIAELPYELSYQGAYLHLFPGHIEEGRGGFKGWLCEHLKARPDVSYCFDNPGHLEVTVQVGQVTRKLELRPPYRIEGQNFREALAKRETATRDAEAAVAKFAAHVCPTCGGSGTDIPAPAPKKRRRR